MLRSYAREMSAWEQPILPPITGCATAVFTGPQFNASGNVWNCDSGTSCPYASKSYMYDVHIPVDPCKIQLSFASCEKLMRSRIVLFVLLWLPWSCAFIQAANHDCWATRSRCQAPPRPTTTRTCRVTALTDTGAMTWCCLFAFWRPNY